MSSERNTAGRLVRSAERQRPGCDEEYFCWRKAYYCKLNQTLSKQHKLQQRASQPLLAPAGPSEALKPRRLFGPKAEEGSLLRKPAFSLLAMCRGAPVDKNVRINSIKSLLNSIEPDLRKVDFENNSTIESEQRATIEPARRATAVFESHLARYTLIARPELENSNAEMPRAYAKTYLRQRAANPLRQSHREPSLKERIATLGDSARLDRRPLKTPRMIIEGVMRSSEFSRSARLERQSSASRTKSPSTARPARSSFKTSFRSSSLA